MKRDGFTLLELLVVIAIIAVLVGVFAPALSNAGAAGRSMECQSNLRQMAMAAHHYAATYSAWPAAIRYEQVNGVFHNVAWDWVTTFGNELVSPGSLWEFTDNPDRVMHCPDCLNTPTQGEPFTGYNYNTTYIGGEAPSLLSLGWDNFRKGVPPHACCRSSQCAMFGDGGRHAGTNRYMRAPLNSEGLALATIYSGGQAFRHLKQSNVAFVDGHVGTAAQPCEGALATPSLLNQLGFPRNGFLSDDDRAYNPR